MPDKGFGSDLWRNLQAIKLGKDGGIEAPVRASDRDGVVVGVEHVAEAERVRSRDAVPPEPRKRGRWARLLRH
jgi:hypothetical protein